MSEADEAAASGLTCKLEAKPTLWAGVWDVACYIYLRGVVTYAFHVGRFEIMPGTDQMREVKL